MNNSIRLLLERNYPHEVIVNPYKNFYEFYNKYDTPQSDGKVVTNKLQMQLGNKNFLSTCKNKKGENYYKKYKELYISEPYVEPVYEPGDYQYFISNENLQNILNQLKQRESYSDHLITYNYKEFPSEITVDEYDNIGSGKKQIDKMIEDKKKELYPDEIDWNKYEYIKKITKIYDFLKGKGDITYSGKKYGISEDFYDKVIKESKGWVDFFYDEKFHYTTTKTSLYKDEKKIFSHENLYLGVDGAINRLGYIGGKLSFEYTYFEDDSKENINSDIWWGGESLNQKYQLNGSKNLFEYNGKIGFITSNQDGMFLMYDGKQITEFFSGIRTISCCMISKFPFDIYDNGVLQFVFRRDNELYVGSLELF
ncbi:MAG: hypothetical protein GY828_06505 [Candidatus Gracilibacteria bacterium]|nr:hypothetical protein [Candidatus Gracilibacteria bacterium]